VSDVIDKAVTSNNYENLSRDIGGLMKTVTDTATGAATTFAESVNEAAKKNAEEKRRREEAEKRAQEAARRRREEAERAAREKAARERSEAEYFAKGADTGGAKVLSVLGGIGTAFFGVVAAVLGIVGAAVGGTAGSILLPMAVVAGVAAACSFAVLHFNRKTVTKTEHFKKYRTILLRRKYASIADISRETGVPEKKVVSELKDFTAGGLIRQGHFDQGETCFIASDDLYEQYLHTQKRAQEMKASEAAQAKREDAMTPEVRELLSQGNNYIRMIHEANARIPGEEVTEKLNRMETIVRRIFDEVRERPELAGSLNLFMDYYLPTTTKLINAYVELDKNPVQGDNITSAKREIENSLDTICDAYEKLLDSFFRDTAMDVSSDISVMKMMMQQEGLTEDELTAMQNQEKAREQAAGQVQTAGGYAAMTAEQAQYQKK
jgi:5-bromo-4-chloroindolyl phosphate hydrolysis protein